MFLTAKFLFPIGSKFHFLLNLQYYQSLYLENLIENLSQLNYFNRSINLILKRLEKKIWSENSFEIWPEFRAVVMDDQNDRALL